VLQQATLRYPVDPSAFLVYATAAEQQSHFDAARAALIDYGALVSDDAEFATRATQIGVLSLRLNEPATAVAWLQRAAAASPDDLQLPATLADAQLKAGDREAAQGTVARALEKDPTSPLLLALSRRLR